MPSYTISTCSNVCSFFFSSLLTHKFFHRAKKIPVTDKDLKPKELKKKREKEEKAKKEEKKGKKGEESEDNKKEEEPEEDNEESKKKKKKQKIKLDMHLEQVTIYYFHQTILVIHK